MSEVYIVRPGEHAIDARGNRLPEREFPADSPIPKLPANKGICRLIVRADEPKPTRKGKAKDEPRLEPGVIFGEDHED